MVTNDWQQAVAEHEAAIEACIVASRRVPDSKWNLAHAEGKWSPAQHLEHVGLSYQMVIDALSGSPPRARLGRMRQLVLRTFVLPKILRTNVFREGVPAPRETRPPGEPQERAAVEELLRSRAAKCIEALLASNRRGARVQHPYFGPLPLLDMLRLGTSHARHHTALLDDLAAREA
jgi:hypothetical protein